MLKVWQIADWVNARAPFDTQLDFDNCGLSLGNGDDEVCGIHFALDCTEKVLDEMDARGANLLITHHPLMFHAIRRILPDDRDQKLVARMLRSGYSLIAAHTCLDVSAGGINDTLVQTIGLENISGEGFMRLGSLREAMTVNDFAAHLEHVLGDSVRVMGPRERLIRTAAVASGAGSDCWEEACSLGADAFVSGEIRHHHALAAAGRGMVCFECGHYATEAPGIFALADALQADELVVQSNTCVSKSAVGGYQD